jgi:hypothetical protein
MSINYIPNDPLASSTAPGIRAKTKRPNRPASRAGFALSNGTAEGTFEPGTAEFLFWQCREAGLAALEAWEAVAGTFARWQGNRKKMALLQDEGVDINAFYDRDSFSFFHRQIGDKVFFSGASTDVVAHEVGHGLLDALRPDLWDAPFLETGAFHEAFGDCVAILTALNDPETRTKLLASAPSLKKKNFVESTAEELSDGIRRLLPTHNAAEPRHAHNDFQFAIPETLPDTGGPGELINEVHSFGMIFSGCFYDLIGGIFAAQPTQTSASLLTAVKTAGGLLMGGAATAEIGPRFVQAVGRAMVLADEEQNDGAHRDQIRAAFAAHNIQLGANALLAPVAVLAGKAPGVSRRPKVAAATRKDLADRLGLDKGARLSVELAELPGRRFARVVHNRTVSLGAIDKRLKGVTVSAPVPVIVGASNGRAAIMGALPETVSTDREVEAFVRSLVKNGQIEFGGPNGAAANARSAAAGPAGRKKPVSRETHRVRSVGGKKVLARVRFHCDCRHR